MIARRSLLGFLAGLPFAGKAALTASQPEVAEAVVDTAVKDCPMPLVYYFNNRFYYSTGTEVIQWSDAQDFQSWNPLV